MNRQSPLAHQPPHPSQPHLWGWSTHHSMRWALALMWWVSGFMPLLIYLPLDHPALHNLHSRIEFELSSLGWGSFSPSMMTVTLFFAALINGLLGACALWGRTPKVWLAQIIIVLGYTLILTRSHGALWLDPFGSLLKNLPILVILWQHYQAATHTSNNR